MSVVRNVLLPPHRHPFGSGLWGTVLTQYVLQYDGDSSFNLVEGRGRMEMGSLKIHASRLQHHCQEMLRFLCIFPLAIREN